MRGEVVLALASLAHLEHQWQVWVRHLSPPEFEDCIDQNIHTLFDDTRVLEIPGSGIGDVIYADEVPALTALTTVYDPLIERLGDVGDERYISDPHWPEVVRLAGVAYEVLRRNDARMGTGLPSGWGEQPLAIIEGRFVHRGAGARE